MAEKTKLTKTGINAITSPFRWIIITGIIYFIASGTIEIIRVWMYMGFYIIGSLPIPFAFGSICSFIPVSIMILLVFLRTFYEDKTLQNELEGYKEYCQNVKFRLMPFLW